MAEKKEVNVFTGSIFYGLTSQGLSFKDKVDVEIEGDKLACYENKKSMLGKSKGTNLLRTPLRRVNGIILGKPSEIIELSQKEAVGDEMAGENIAEAAKWLAENVSGFGSHAARAARARITSARATSKSFLVFLIIFASDNSFD